MDNCAGKTERIRFVEKRIELKGEKCMDDIVPMLAFILIALCCIICLVLLFIVIVSFPIYIIVFYFAWIICSLTLLSFSNKKWPIQICITILFCIIVINALPECTYNFDPDTDGKLPLLIMIIGNLPLIYFCAAAIRDFRKRKKLKAVQAKTRIIESKISEIESTINELQNELQNSCCILHLIGLFEKCGEDVKNIKNDFNIDEIQSISNEIQKQTDELQRLKDLWPK